MQEADDKQSGAGARFRSGGEFSARFRSATLAAGETGAPPWPRGSPFEATRSRVQVPKSGPHPAPGRIQRLGRFPDNTLVNHTGVNSAWSNLIQASSYLIQGAGSGGLDASRSRCGRFRSQARSRQVWSSQKPATSVAYMGSAPPWSLPDSSILTAVGRPKPPLVTGSI